ncbi:hypothetical protein CH275_26920 [Rhodococcus sp. 06-235-1A]|uniref:(2Fe-2S)-binding protein n=1 Tax=Rhodococcus sp. 06-235-1A TaxID=2022508 RepID=UPI000B9B9075|nr:2Fe-2S iron-sulfur cluster-binding protein [Rhodococcus sp. 06-235-1A]OZC95418.1 hypothetical protein CH275_26920 [Rhodococcus sp. 06-235-1A]
MLIDLSVNDTPHQIEAEDRTLLIDALAEVGARAIPEGCSEGMCGSCTVLADGEPIRSCTALAAEMSEVDITTTEGLNSPDEQVLTDLQQAFSRAGALQCGYCTPGMLMVGAWLAARHRDETDPISGAVVRRAINGNLCRCTGYEPIVAALCDYIDNQRTPHIDESA